MRGAPRLALGAAALHDWPARPVDARRAASFRRASPAPSSAPDRRASRRAGPGVESCRRGLRASGGLTKVITQALRLRDDHTVLGTIRNGCKPSVRVVGWMPAGRFAPESSAESSKVVGGYRKGLARAAHCGEAYTSPVVPSQHVPSQHVPNQCLFLNLPPEACSACGISQ